MTALALMLVPYRPVFRAKKLASVVHLSWQVFPMLNLSQRTKNTGDKDFSLGYTPQYLG